MKKQKNTRAVRILLALGTLLCSGTLLIHSSFPGMPDFLRGAMEGMGVGLVIVGLVARAKGRGSCASSGSADAETGA